VYKFQISTELMKNHKAAQALPPQAQFDALQTVDGQGLFFSIGDNKMFYLSAEQQSSKTGWAPINLTNELSANFTGKTVTAKTFAVSQELQSGSILIAQAVHVAEENTDYLYLLPNLSGAQGAEWLASPDNRNWLARPFDDTENPVSSLDVTYVNITPHQNTSQAPYIIVGLRNPETLFIQNYRVSVDPTVTSKVWQQYSTAENYEQLFGMCLGKSASAFSPGFYELYMLNNKVSLTFTPVKGFYNAPPIGTKLTPPAGASSIATLPADEYGHTNLYVAGTGGIYLYTPAAQTSFNASRQIIASELITGVQNLEVHLDGSQVVLWGQNNQGQVFYSRCQRDLQSDPAAWSSPIPIQANVLQIATVLNRQTQANELYVHTAKTEGSESQLLRLAQDPVTTEWRSQNILLPLSNVQDVIEFYTYTTHINVVDENNLPLPNTSFPITANGVRTVYLNDAYVSLSPTTPQQAQSDATGTVTLVQVTDTLGATCYDMVQGDGTKVNINPMQGIIQKMNGVTGEELYNTKVINEQGQSTPLVTGGTQQQCQDTATALSQFVTLSSTMPQDGSLKNPNPAGAVYRKTFNPETDRIWGMSFANNEARYFEGLDQMQGMGLSFNAGAIAIRTPTVELDDIWQSIEAWAGDIFNWLKSAADDVEQFFIKVVGDVTHFFIQIGKQFYRFVINCMSDVLHGIEFVFKKIAVALEKLVEWVGFIFNWNDIKRTHQVIKNIFKLYVQYAIGKLPAYRESLANQFGKLEGEISNWAGLPDTLDSMTGCAAKSTPRPGQNSPQAHWGVYHAKNNASEATSLYSPSVNGTSELEELLNQVKALLANEEEKLTDAGNSIAAIFHDKEKLSAKEMVEQVVGVIVTLLVETVQNIILTGIDIIAILVQGIMDILDATIDIPVISWLYKKISGDDLSFLDLVCLITAIPATIIYKLATKGEAPFPQNALTDEIISATDFARIQQLCASDGAFTAETAATAEPPPGKTLSEKFTITFESCACFGTAILIPLTLAKTIYPGSGLLFGLYGLAYLPYVAPNIPVATTSQTWDVIMNEAVTGVSVVKTMADIALYKAHNAPPETFITKWAGASPGFEALINGCWEIPVAVGLYRKHDAQGLLSFFANTGFNFSGILAPLSKNFVVLSAIGGCMGIYGLLELAQIIEG
jgi:hypothetical protein